MLKTILVGLNGSQHSQAAVDVALAWAAQHGARLLGVAVVDTPRVTPPESVPLGASAFKRSRDEAVLQSAAHDADQLLEDFRTRCAQAGVVARAQQVEGDPAMVLAVQAQQADLIVVGRKTVALGATEQPSLVHTKLLRHLSRPVLSVASANAGQSAALIAYDGSIQAAKALHMFVALGLAEGRDLHVLCVSRQPEERHVELAGAFLGAHGYAAHLHVQTTKLSTEADILEEAVRLDVGLLVMGSFGQPKLKEMMFGSVTSAILDNSPIPLLLYH